MKKIFFFILTILSLQAFSQSKLYLRGDSVYIQSAVNGELILLNGSRLNTGAYLKNTGNGRTNFSYVLDSVWVDGDSVRFRYGPTTISHAIGGGNQNLQNVLDEGFTATSDMALTGTLGIDGKLSLAHQLSSPFTPSAGFGYLYYFDDSLRFKTPTTTFTLGRGDGGSVVHQNLSNTALLADNDYTHWWNSKRLKIVGFDQFDFLSDTALNGGRYGLSDWKTSKGKFLFSFKDSTAGAYLGPKDSANISVAFNATSLNEFIQRPDSTYSNKKLSYTHNLASTYGPYSLVTKHDLDSTGGLKADTSDFIQMDLSGADSGYHAYLHIEDGDTTIKFTSTSTSTDSLFHIEFEADDEDMVEVGDSVLISDDFIDNKVFVHVNGLKRRLHATDGIEFIDDSILVFHPALEAGDYVDIEIWKIGNRTANVHTPIPTGGGGSATPITFVGSNLNNSSGEWTKTGGGGWEGMGVGESLAASTSGYIQATRTDASSHTAFIGFEGDNTVETFSGFGAGPAAIYWNSSGQVGKMDGGGFGAAGSIGVTLSIGETAGIFRDGTTGVYTLKISTDGGATWGSVVYTFTGTQTAQIWAKCSIDTGGTLSQPKKSY